MTRRSRPSLLLTPLLLSGLLAMGSAAGAAPDRLTVDWTRSEGAANRALFSVQGFMQAYVEPNPFVLETFKLLNPRGTQTRLETWIHRMEPENDNDDPATFNWEAYRPQQMVRMIEDRNAFDAKLEELGMEPLSLLCYSADWLKKEKGNRVDDIEEWAEFAAAVVETYNGRGDDYCPNLRWVQLWNEPNFHFWEQSDEEFFALYNTAAERLKANYPGIMIGGPTLTNSGEQPIDYMRRFLEACGHNTDYVVFHHYGPQGEGVEPLMEYVDGYLRMFREITGNRDGKIMMTETDAWFAGFPKMDFMMERQFEFIRRQADIAAIHHFCVMYYNESGNYAFGLIDRHGGVVGGTFWPYWLFRNWIGDMAPVTKNGDQGTRFNATATRTDSADSQIMTAVFHNPTDSRLQAPVELFFEPAPVDRVLAIGGITTEHQGLRAVRRIRAGQRHFSDTLTLAPGEALSYTLQETGDRFYEFADLNNQERPWLEITSDTTVMPYKGSAEMEVRVLNTLFEPLSGTVALDGLPDGWSYELLDEEPTIEGLAFGEEKRLRYRIDAASFVEADRVGVRAVLAADDRAAANAADAPHSIAHTFDLQLPMHIVLTPQEVLATPGGETEFAVQITNTDTETLSGSVRADFFADVAVDSPQQEWTLEEGERGRYTFKIRLSEDVDVGEVPLGKITVSLGDANVVQSMRVRAVEPMAAAGSGTIVPLEEYRNFDPMSFLHNRGDYDESMGMFIYPADFTPSGRTLNVAGIPLQMPSIEDGKESGVLPKGQKLQVPPGNYAKVAMVGVGHDGKHPGTWTLHYADGSSDAVESEIPEWCVAPPEGTVELFPAPHRYTMAGPAGPACQLWLWTIPADPEKALVAVDLPTFDRGAYIFAMTALE